MKRFRGIVLGIIMVILLTMPAIVEAATGFKDTQLHWAEDDINTLVAKGAVKGYVDSTFRPENKITRAEFTAILLRSMGKDPGNSTTGYWADRYIAEATEKGYIRKGDFDDVTTNITRGEIARMIVNALGDATYPQNLFLYSAMVADYISIPAAFQNPILKAFVSGIMRGRPDGAFGCNDTASRAEGVTMIVRLLDKSKRVVPDLSGVATTPTPVPTPVPTKTPTVSDALKSNPVGKALTELDGYGSSSYDPDEKYYNILFGEVNPNNRNRIDCTLKIRFPSDELKLQTKWLAHIEVIRNTTTNLERYKKALQILLPGFKDDLYQLTVERMAWKGSDFSDTFHNDYHLFIMHLDAVEYPREEQGVMIEVNRK